MKSLSLKPFVGGGKIVTDKIPPVGRIVTGVDLSLYIGISSGAFTTPINYFGTSIMFWIRARPSACIYLSVTPLLLSVIDCFPFWGI